MSVVGPVSEAPACTALHLSSSKGSVPHGRGGGGVWVTQLGISPAHRAILQPLGRAGGGQQGTRGILKRPEPPTLQPPEGSRLHQCLRSFQKEVPPAVNSPVPGPARLCSGPRGTCRGGACLSNLGLCFSSSRDPRDLSPRDPSAA